MIKTYVLALAAVITLTAMPFSRVAEAAGDRAAISACDEFRRAVSDYSAGGMTLDAVTERFRTVNNIAGRSTTHPVVRDAAAAIWRSMDPKRITGGDFTEAANRLIQVCLTSVLESPSPERTVMEKWAGWPWPTSGPPVSSSLRLPIPDRRQIPVDEAQRARDRALDRAGETGAKCVDKQYGSGWVTVCE